MSVPRFWREIPQRYNLRATRCTVCGTAYFPPRDVCPDCRRESIGNMVEQRLVPRGVVREWTRVHKAASGYESQVPYIMALIETEQGPSVMGQIVESDGAGIERGTPVHGVFRKIGEDGAAGVIHYGTKWRLDSEEHGSSSPFRPLDEEE